MIRSRRHPKNRAIRADCPARRVLGSGCRTVWGISWHNSAHAVPLKPGERLGSLEIVSLLGRGGMGEVYRAHDTELGRDVAVKILPETFTDDSDRVARFRREAQILASLNHPHIATIYGLQDHDRQRVLVLELVDGESLDARLARGRIPVDEALPMAKQIAQALEAAHDKGIVHRDLKPANIAVTTDGRIKVLDFGLAKALEPASGVPASAMNSPTVTSRALMTGIGVIVGTAAYMAPEQAQGRPADKRTDIWAFGCVLYEMVTSQRAFNGETISDTLAAILRGEPDWSRLPAGSPRALVTLLRRCLARDRARRLRDIGDVVLELDDVAAAGADEGEPARSVVARRRGTWIWAGLAGIALLTAGVIGWRSTRLLPHDDRVLRFDLSLPAGVHLGGPIPMIAPDGRSLAFVGLSDGVRSIWVRPLDGDWRRLDGTEQTDGRIFWSPDSRLIGFVDTQHNLKKISAAGGPAQIIAMQDKSRDRDWGPDGTILLGGAGDLRRVSAAGGVETVERSLDAAARERTIDYPRFLPDGRQYLALVRYRAPQGAPAEQSLCVGALGSARLQCLADIRTEAWYARTGHLIFQQEGMLMAQRFDPSRLTVTGEATAVTGDVFRRSSLATYSLSTLGDLLYRVPQMAYQVEWVDSTGRRVGSAGLPQTPGRRYMQISPDGKRLLFAVDDEVWVHEFNTGVTSRLATNLAPPRHIGFPTSPVWSGDGQTVFYASIRDTYHASLYSRDAGGIGPDRLVLRDAMFDIPLDASRDGRFLLYRASAGQLGDEESIWALPLAAGSKPFRIAASATVGIGGAAAAKLSPDGKWIAYVSNETGIEEVYVQSFPEPGFRQQISRGGRAPAWSADGRHIFYVNSGLQMMSVAVRAVTGRLEIDAPRMLFQTELVPFGGNNATEYTVAPDGRFLMSLAASVNPMPLSIVVNWASTLPQ